MTQSPTCGLGKYNEKERKIKDSGKLAIRSDHTRCRIDVKVCVTGAIGYAGLHVKYY